ncbi:MAG TPA: helix-turn-helix domain-containing protein [Solirubrobacterales bacterium]
MATAALPSLIDTRLLKAQSHPIRAHILNILSEGPSSPGRMHRRMEGVSLSLVCHHVKVLREVGLIELIDVRKHGGRKEHIYRATKWQSFDQEEWEAIDPKFRDPIVGTILRQISEDAGRAAAEGRFNALPDRHLSRSPIEVDRQGWQEVLEALEGALAAILEAHGKSKERAYESGEELLPARVVMMQFPIGRFAEEDEPPAD